MKLSIAALFLCLAVLPDASSLAEDRPDPELELMGQAKISRTAAEKAALAKIPHGKVQDSVIQKEDGKLVWLIEMALPKTKNFAEVAVDAVNGQIVGVEIETPDEQSMVVEHHGKKRK